MTDQPTAHPPTTAESSLGEPMPLLLEPTFTGSLTAYLDPCWVVGEDDYEQHFRSHDDAQEWADRVNADQGDDPEWNPWAVRRGDDCCALVSCAHCGYAFDEEGDGVVHVAVDSLPVNMGDHGWVLDGEAALCSDCACEALGHDFRFGDRPGSRPSRYCWRCSARKPLSSGGGSDA